MELGLTIAHATSAGINSIAPVSHFVTPCASAAPLREFPGMPLLTHEVRSSLRRESRAARLALVLDDTPSFAHLQFESYSVFVGTEYVGRYTIRRRARFVERDFFCLRPESFSVAGRSPEGGGFRLGAPAWRDTLRVFVEATTVACKNAFSLLASVTRSKEPASPRLHFDACARA